MSSRSVRVASRVRSAVFRTVPSRSALRARYGEAARAHPVARGFTLIELLTVVVIMGVLAAIGLGGFRRRAQDAETLEVKAMLKSIAAAQEAHRGQFMVYLDVSGDLNTLFPRTTPDGKSTTFFQGGSSALEARWRRLAPTTPQLVSFGYATVAGLPGGTYPSLRSGVPAPTWPTAVEPWYVVQAVGNEDADSTEAVAIVTSFAPQMYWKDPEE